MRRYGKINRKEKRRQAERESNMAVPKVVAIVFKLSKTSFPTVTHSPMVSPTSAKLPLRSSAQCVGISSSRPVIPAPILARLNRLSIFSSSCWRGGVEVVSICRTKKGTSSYRMARLSGLQRDVLSLYRHCLRAVRQKPAVSIYIRCVGTDP